MPNSVPNEMIVAKLSMEAASIALESLFQKMLAVPRSEKVIATDPVQEAITRLRAAQDLLAELEGKLVAAKDP